MTTDHSKDGAPLEFVPHKNGLLRASKVVSITIRGTAKERHLWQLAAVKAGTSISEKIREQMNQFADSVLTEEDLEHLDP